MYFKHTNSKTEIGPANFFYLTKASPNCKKLAKLAAEMKNQGLHFDINMDKMIHHVSFFIILPINQH